MTEGNFGSALRRDRGRGFRGRRSAPVAVGIGALLAMPLGLLAGGSPPASASGQVPLVVYPAQGYDKAETQAF